MLGFSGLLLIVGIGVVVIALTAASRMRYVNPDETFATRGWASDYLRTLPPGLTLLAPTELIIKGDRQSRFPYTSKGPGGDANPTAFLRDKSGKIDLRWKQSAVRFQTSTRDAEVEMQFTARVEFRVDRKNHRSLHDRGDEFGGILEGRIKDAIRDQVNQRTPLDIRHDREEIITAIRDQLIKRQAELGIEFGNVEEFWDTVVRGPARTPAGPGGVERTEPSGIATVREGVAFMNEDQLKRIMDLFADPAQKQKALLAILEMQTRLDIAEALSKSNQLVVVTAQELGLLGSATFLDATRKLSAPASAKE
jgi:hypothetical protein